MVYHLRKQPEMMIMLVYPEKQDILISGKDVNKLKTYRVHWDTSPLKLVLMATIGSHMPQSQGQELCVRSHFTVQGNLYIKQLYQ